MTITIGLLAHEGLVLGSDSTTTVSVPNTTGGRDKVQLFNCAQKLFEIGPHTECFVPGETFSGGFVFFGDGSFGPLSWREVVNDFHCDAAPTMRHDDDLAAKFNAYCQSKWIELQVAGEIPQGSPMPAAGCFVGGVAKGSRRVQCASINIATGLVSPLNRGDMRFGGASETVHRIIDGYDLQLKANLLAKGVAPADFQACAAGCGIILHERWMPLRDAIDLVHFLIYATIKMHRYRGGMAEVGGPIEIAAITADRGFRWVVHKPLAESIGVTDAHHLA